MNTTMHHAQRSRPCLAHICRLVGAWSAPLVLSAAVLLPSAPARAEDKPDFPKFEEVTKDTKTIEGFYTIYHDEKKDKLFARIPTKSLDKPFLLATSISKGPEYAGWQWLDGAVYWQRLDKKLVLMAADPRYKKGEGTTVEDVIARTYTDTIVQSVPIATEVDGDPVIDLAKLLKTDIAQVRDAFPGRVDASLSRFSRARNFPKNLEIDVDLAMSPPGGGAGAEVGVHYSFHYLPETDYQPREADPRVGYFITPIKDWTTKHGESTIFKRHVNRWQLRKALPDEDVSDVRPEDQIVFYIEKTVPVQYRRYVRDGILEWNKAFEAAGYRNAVAAIQQTDTAHADKDPEDVQYNFIRWIVTGRPFAMGPSRVNPFTGQILDADIIFDDSMVRFVTYEFDVYGPKAMDVHTDGPMLEMLESHGDVVGFTLDGVELARPDDHIASKPSWLATGAGHVHDARCEMGRGVVRELAFASLEAIQAGGRDLPEEYVGAAIKETVMHEVGHTFGLRHNFKASSWKRLAEKNPPGNTTLPTTASVMDYNPYTFTAEASQQGAFATPTLGPYDYWAIDYGYRQFQKKDDDEKAPKDEKEMLERIASRCAEPGLDYATDEDTSDMYPDPLVNRWDDGRDPMEFAADRIATAERLWKDGLNWAVEDGQSLERTRRVFNMLLGQYGFAARLAARVVGGELVHRDHKGDPNERPPIQPIPAAQQRAALGFLGDSVFSDRSFQFSPQLLNSLAAGRWSHWDSDAMDSELSFDVHDRILAIRSRVLFQLMNPATVNRVYDAQMRADAAGDAFTVPELFTTTQSILWSEIEAGKGGAGPFSPRMPLISSYRRAAQREHLQRLAALVTARTGTGLYPDAQAVARFSLKNLGSQIDRVLVERGTKLDEASRAHLEESRARINKALDAEFRLRS